MAFDEKVGKKYEYFQEKSRNLMMKSRNKVGII